MQHTLNAVKTESAQYTVFLKSIIMQYSECSEDLISTVYSLLKSIIMQCTLNAAKTESVLLNIFLKSKKYAAHAECREDRIITPIYSSLEYELCSVHCIQAAVGKDWCSYALEHMRFSKRHPPPLLPPKKTPRV